MAEATTAAPAQGGTISNIATTVGSNSGNIAVGSVYLSNVVALIHWFFMCLSEKKLVEPDDLTKTLLGAMLTHVSAKISGWFGKKPGLVKAVDVAEIVADELEKAGIPAMAEKVAAGQSLTLLDKAEILKAVADVSGKVDTALKARPPTATPGAPPQPFPKI